VNKEETLAVYEQGSDAWNAWAEKTLADCTALETAGAWKNASKAYFEEHSFDTEADIRGFIFPGGAGFDGTTFRDTAGFGGATFRGTAWFGLSVFNCSADFTNAVFQGAAASRQESRVAVRPDRPGASHPSRRARARPSGGGGNKQAELLAFLILRSRC
jgi:hypothetical protein